MADPELLQIFLEELDELFEAAQNALIALPQGEMTRISEVYRAFHAWKGSAALFGFQNLYQLTAAYSEFLVTKKDAPQLTLDHLALLEEGLKTIKQFRDAIAAEENIESISVATLVEAVQNQTPK